MTRMGFWMSRCQKGIMNPVKRGAQETMPDLDLLAKLLTTISEGPPAVNDSLCLNRRYKAANCQRCGDACPVTAIQVYGPNIDLDDDACVRCGLCLNVCPTGVFSSPQQLRDDKRLLDSAASHAARSLELTCPANAHPERTVAPVDAVLQTGRCLAALSLGELLDLVQARRRDLWLNDGGCASCPLARVLPAIHAAADQANRILSAWHTTGRVHLQTKMPEACVPLHRVDQYSGTQPSYSRREFFTFLRHSAAQIVSDIAVDTLAPNPPDLSVVPPVDRPVLPLHRRRLAAALNRLGDPPAAPLSLGALPWAEVEVSAQCTGCSLCARFCPTGAIRWADEPATPRVGEDEPVTTMSFALHFIAADCIDCGICATACPEGAVQLAETIDAARLVRRRSTPLHVGFLAPCVGCGKPTDTQVRETCYVCRISAPVTPAQNADAAAFVPADAG